MKKIIITALVLLFGLAACTSTQVTSSWKASNANLSSSYNKIMVLGIIKQKDRTLREELENQLVSELKEKGYDAHSALQEYGPKAFDRLSEEAIAERMKSDGFDAVLTTVLLDKSKEQNYTPGQVNYQPVGVYYYRFGRYYTTVYDRVYTPGYYTSSTNFFLESNLYDTRTGDLVYSVQTKSFDPSSPAVLGDEYAKAIINDMKKNGLIAKR